MELIKSTQPQSKQAPLAPLFMSFCEELAAIAKSYGINLTPYNNNGLARFNILSLEQQTGIIEALRGYTLQLQAAISEHIMPRGADNRKHAWWSLNKLGLKPPLDLFNQITDQDIIEIYNKDSIQVFRSFDMFQYLSYSLSEIFSHDWTELYDRDEFTFKRVFTISQDILAGKIQHPVISKFPSYIIVEKFSEKKCWAKIQHTIISPLFNPDGSVGGYLSTFRAQDFGNSI